jgi:hypothetical protein
MSPEGPGPARWRNLPGGCQAALPLILLEVARAAQRAAKTQQVVTSATSPEASTE